MDRDILKFVQLMEKELKANSHKGDWKTFIDQDKIIQELYYHLDKLEKVRLTNKDFQLMKEYIADCANILMFLNNSIDSEIQKDVFINNNCKPFKV